MNLADTILIIAMRRMTPMNGYWLCICSVSQGEWDLWQFSLAINLSESSRSKVISVLSPLHSTGLTWTGAVLIRQWFGTGHGAVPGHLDPTGTQRVPLSKHNQNNGCERWQVLGVAVLLVNTHLYVSIVASLHLHDGDNRANANVSTCTHTDVRRTPDTEIWSWTRQ